MKLHAQVNRSIRTRMMLALLVAAFGPATFEATAVEPGNDAPRKAEARSANARQRKGQDGDPLLEATYPAAVTLNLRIELHELAYADQVAADSARAVGGGWETVHFEGFEGTWPGPWLILDDDDNSGTDSWGDVSCSPGGARTGSWTGWCADIGDSPLCGDEYDDDMRAWMIYGPFSLAGATDAEVEFFFVNSSESCCDDFLYMASIDGSSFHGYGHAGTTSNYPNSWQQRLFDLTDVPDLGDITGESEVWFAFLFRTDSSVRTFGGAYVDDVTIRRALGGLPDLVPSINALNEPWEWGNPVGADLDITNTGTGSASASTASLVMSSDSTIGDSDDIQIDSFAVPVLGVGEAWGISWPWDLPSAPPSGYPAEGTVRFALIADVGGNVTESNEDNNSDYDSVSMSSGLPDLAADINALQEPWQWGDMVGAHLDIANIGPGSAGASTAVLVMSSDSTIGDSDDVQVDSFGVPALGPGEAWGISWPWELPSAPPSGYPIGGTVRFALIADSGGVVAEVSEDNNVDTDPVSLSAGAPDLVSSIDALAQPWSWGTAVGAELAVENIGAGPAGASTAVLVLSNDATIGDADDFLLGEFEISALNSGSIWGISTQWILPPSPPPGFPADGVVWVGLVADADNSVDESNELNNGSSDPVNITLQSIQALMGNFSSPAGMTAYGLLDYLLFGTSPLDAALENIRASGSRMVDGETERSIHLGTAIGIEGGLAADIHFDVLSSGYTTTYHLIDGSWTMSVGVTVEAATGKVEMEEYLRLPADLSYVVAGVGLSGAVGLAGVSVELGADIPIGGVVSAEIQGILQGEIGNTVGIQIERELTPAEFIAAVNPPGEQTVDNAAIASLTPYGDTWIKRVLAGGSSALGPYGSIAIRALPGASKMPINLLAQANDAVTIRAATQATAGRTLGTRAGLAIGIRAVDITVGVIASYTEQVGLPFGYERVWMVGEMRTGDPDDAGDDHSDSLLNATNFSEVLNFSHQASLEQPGDVDWYRITANQGDTFWYYAVSPDMPTPPVMTMYDLGGQPFAESVLSDSCMSLIWTAPQTSDYFVRIVGASPADAGTYGFLLGDFALCCHDAECDDGLFCNGAETCTPAIGCTSGKQPCGLDEWCDETTISCSPFGDTDGDDDVDLRDIRVFLACAEASLKSTGAAQGGDCRAMFDRDGDEDIDLADFQEILGAMTGPLRD